MALYEAGMQVLRFFLIGKITICYTSYVTQGGNYDYYHIVA